MNKNHNGQNKSTRVRVNRNRKWSTNEEMALIKFLSNNREFEKPNSQVYYRRFCDENNVDMPWKTVAIKVRNMRKGFFKAKAWETGEEAASMSKEQIENCVLKKCVNYYHLDGIFGSQVEDFPTNTDFGSENNNIFASITIDSDENSQRSYDYNIPSGNRSPEPELMEIKPDFVDMTTQQLDLEFRAKCEEMGIDEKVLSFKDRINVAELILKEKKQKFKEQQLISREKLKIYAIQSQEKIKLLELEMKERLSREELKLKYK